MRKLFAAVVAVGLLGAAAVAQQPAPEPANTGTTAVQPEKKVTYAEFSKAQKDEMETLRKTQGDEIKALKDSMKGQPKGEIQKAVVAKQKEHKAASMELKKKLMADKDAFCKENKCPKAHKKQLKKAEMPAPEAPKTTTP